MTNIIFFLDCIFRNLRFPLKLKTVIDTDMVAYQEDQNALNQEVVS